MRDDQNRYRNGGYHRVQKVTTRHNMSETPGDPELAPNFQDNMRCLNCND
jgi:hypothetical protein